MTENETTVLRVVEQFTTVTKKKVAAEMGITDEYVHYMLAHLAEEGYLAKIGRDRFTLLTKGVEALVEKLILTKERLEVLVSRHSSDIDRIDKEIERLGNHETQLRDLISTVKSMKEIA